MAETSKTRSEQELTIPPVPEAAPRRGPPRAEPVVAREPGGPLVVSNGRPSEPEELRLEIERTRDRMSHTLDAIEDRLVRQKQDIWAKATLQGFRRKVSSEPWRTLAIAFVAGYIVAAIRD
jgi:hypothetical protein